MFSSSSAEKPTLGLIGFGAFGQLIARHLLPFFTILAHDPAPHDRYAAGLDDVGFVTLADAARCPIVVLATPVGRLAAVVAAIAPNLRPGTLVLDVCSVKIEPAAIMRHGLPKHVDIVATHPLFGPQSARDGVTGLKIALCPVRGRRTRRVAAFLRRSLRLQVIVTTPEAHDREAALAQGLTHLIAKVLVQMEPLPTRMTTRSFDLLKAAVEMVRHDSPEVFRAIEHGNPHARPMRRRFFDLAAALDAALDGEMPIHHASLTRTAGLKVVLPLS